MSIRHRNKIKQATWRTHGYIIDLKSQMNVELSTSNQYHQFDLDKLFTILEIFTGFRCGTLMSNRWRLNKGVSIGILMSFIISRTQPRDSKNLKNEQINK